MRSCLFIYAVFGWLTPCGHVSLQLLIFADVLHEHTSSSITSKSSHTYITSTGEVQQDDHTVSDDKLLIIVGGMTAVVHNDIFCFNLQAVASKFVFHRFPTSLPTRARATFCINFMELNDKT